MADTERIFKDLYNVLVSPATGKIDFICGSIHIDEPGFKSIAALMGAGYVTVALRDNFPAGAGGLYLNDRNQFVFPSGGYSPTVETRMYMVHEAAHAIHDLHGGGTYMSRRGSRFTTFSENEAAGYVAGSLYALYFEEIHKTPVPSINDPNWVKAMQVARSIQGKKAAPIPRNDVMKLRELVATDSNPVYRAKDLWG